MRKRQFRWKIGTVAARIPAESEAGKRSTPNAPTVKSTMVAGGREKEFCAEAGAGAVAKGAAAGLDWLTQQVQSEQSSPQQLRFVTGALLLTGNATAKVCATMSSRLKTMVANFFTDDYFLAASFSFFRYVSGLLSNFFLQLLQQSLIS